MARARGDPRTERRSRARADRVVVLPDVQIWDSTRPMDGDHTVREELAVYRESVAPDASLYLIHLASSGALVTPEGYEGVYDVSGWSESVL